MLKIIHRALSQVKNFRSLYKGISCLLDWSQFFPLSDKALSFLESSQNSIDLYSATFAVPQLVRKVIEVFERRISCRNSLSERHRNCHEIDRVRVAGQNSFVLYLEVMSGSCKMFKSFDKTNLLDLAKLSKKLPGLLTGINLVADIVITSCKSYDSWMQLSELMSKQPPECEELNTAFHAQKKQLMFKLATKITRLIPAFLSLITLFSLATISPLIPILFSTLIFILTLLSKIQKQEINLILASKKFYANPFAFKGNY